MLEETAIYRRDNMRIAIFGLSISSSWGNGHATIWRALCAALARRRHQIVFFERNLPYYVAHRDLYTLPYGRIVFYNDWSAVLKEAQKILLTADIGLVTSYCPDARDACDLLLGSPQLLRVYYDLDSPVTLASKRMGIYPEYIPRYGLGDFDLVLSYAGGRALELLRTEFNAQRTLPLYGCVDAAAYQPVPPVSFFQNSLSYIGTYAQDRVPKLHELFIETARRRPSERFFLVGPLYPPTFPWRDNIFYRSHIAPGDHAVFYSSSRVTLNITRQAMAEVGHCPSSRLFEAAACGVPIISDSWEGIDQFLTPGEELFLAESSNDVIKTLAMHDAELQKVAKRAQRRTLEEHSGDIRAREMERVFTETS